MTKRVSTLALIGIGLFFGIAIIPAQKPTADPQQEEPNVKIEAHVKEHAAGVVSLEVEWTNLGKSAVYFVTDPRRSDKSKGPYIFADSADSSLLICAFQFYGPNPFGPFVEHQGARLNRLEAGQSHAELIRLSFPLRGTDPPFVWGDPKVLWAPPISRVRVDVAILPASASLVELTTQKPEPHDV
jgi:hypothetical protein